MSNADWEITLRFNSNDGDYSKKLTLAITGSWDINGGCRNVDECVALDFGSIIKMLRESGTLIHPAETSEEVIKAFADSWN